MQFHATWVESVVVGAVFVILAAAIVVPLWFVSRWVVGVLGL